MVPKSITLNLFHMYLVNINIIACVTGFVVVHLLILKVRKVEHSDKILVSRGPGYSNNIQLCNVGKSCNLRNSQMPNL